MMNVKQLGDALAAVRVLGETSLSVGVAITLAQLRRELEQRFAPYDEAHTALIRNLSGGHETLEQGHPSWTRYLDERAKLFVTEVDPPARVQLRVKADELGSVAANVLYALDPVLELELVRLEVA